MLPKWDSSFSVHNAKIDDQHKKFLSLQQRLKLFLIDR
ncbi:hypothetical protein cco71_03107 [Campylobacter coli 317/04]|nr:hypothetical protein cco71_03107 [Campylobacter coli 317/04]